MNRRQTQERILRLKAAIGEGPHAASFNADQHLKAILVTLKDDQALELLKK